MCFSSKHPEQITIPAGGTFSYECDLSVTKPGAFESEITLYLEDDGIREVTLTVRGVGVAPEGQAKAAAKP